MPKFNLSIILIISGVIIGCISPPPGSMNEINHIVLVWFNNTVSNEEIEEIITETQKLKAISSVKTLAVGKSLESKRKMVDDSFDLAIKITFSSVKGLDNYIDHPLHNSFLQKYIKGKVAKIKIYDFE